MMLCGAYPFARDPNQPLSCSWLYKVDAVPGPIQYVVQGDQTERFFQDRRCLSQELALCWNGMCQNLALFPTISAMDDYSEFRSLHCLCETH